VLDAVRVIVAAEGAAGVVPVFLKRGDFAIEAAEDVHHFGKGAEIGFDVFGVGSFLNEDLGEAGGGGLEADFRELGSGVAAEVIEHRILIQAILENDLLIEPPFQITTCGPVGYVALCDAETQFVKGFDNVLVGDAVPNHAVDHVALEFGEGSDAAFAAGFVGLSDLHRNGLGFNDKADV
jgi:hypothetical protein